MCVHKWPPAPSPCAVVMMDAEPLDSALEPNLDMEQFDSYVDQISNLSDSIGEKAA